MLIAQVFSASQNQGIVRIVMGLAIAASVENTGVIRNYIRESRIPEIVDFVERGDNPSNKLFMHALVEAAQNGNLTPEIAAAASGNKSDFDRAMRGIS